MLCFISTIHQIQKSLHFLLSLMRSVSMYSDQASILAEQALHLLYLKQNGVWDGCRYYQIHTVLLPITHSFKYSLSCLSQLSLELNLTHHKNITLDIQMWPHKLKHFLFLLKVHTVWPSSKKEKRGNSLSQQCWASGWPHEPHFVICVGLCLHLCQTSPLIWDLSGNRGSITG